LNLDQEAAHMF